MRLILVRLAAICLASVLLHAAARAHEFAHEDDPLVRHTSAHYELVLEGTPAEARELGLVLEQAWPLFCSYFKAEPELKEGQRLTLLLYATRAGLLRASSDDGVAPPAWATSAWYSSRTRKGYAHRHPCAYATRATLLYAACVQFQMRAKAKNADLETTWFVHGAAESLATHFWNEGKLELGTRPRASVVDHAAQALEALGGDHLGLEPWFETQLADLSVCWAVIRFALEGGEGKYRERYEKLALGHTGSKLSGEDFARALGRVENVTHDFNAWLRAAQAPFEVLTWDWEDRGEGGLVARARGRALAVCKLKRPANVLRVRIARLGRVRPSAGIVLSMKDAANCTLARTAPPMLWIERIESGELVSTLPFLVPWEDGDMVQLEARREGRNMLVRFNGKSLGPFEVPEGPLGLFAQDGEVAFSDITFR